MSVETSSSILSPILESEEMEIIDTDCMTETKGTVNQHTSIDIPIKGMLDRAQRQFLQRCHRKKLPIPINISECKKHTKIFVFLFVFCAMCAYPWVYKIYLRNCVFFFCGRCHSFSFALSNGNGKQKPKKKT